LYAVWLVRVLYESIPQALVWLAFLLIAGFGAARSLPWPPLEALGPPLTAAPRSAVADWAGLIRDAARNTYTRESLAQRLGHLANDVLAYQEGTSGRPLWQRLADESLDLPADVRAYLHAGTLATATIGRLRRRWVWRGLGHWPPWDRACDPLDLDPAVVVRLLEQRLTDTTGALE